MRYSDDDPTAQCPETLGEYRDICAALSPHGDSCRAVKFLDTKISESPNGRDEKVIAADSQMRLLLYPMLLEREP